MSRPTLQSLSGHGSMLLACAFWGLMAPLGKHAMTHGVAGLEMVTFRVAGGAACFWLASLWCRRERVSRRDLALLAAAGMLGIVMNQCCYTVGLSLTSPVNASIVTTTLPIVTLVLSALFLGEPVTAPKVAGVAMGCSGAAILITASVRSATGLGGSLAGDLLCLAAQCSFAVYLTLFRHLIQRYSVVTCMRWMITAAAVVIVPLTARRVAALPWADIGARVWWETAYVVAGCTFAAYILMMHGQRTLRPTVVAMYNYVQPIVACVVSVAMGLGVFGWGQAAAVALVFGGVWLVTQSKSRQEARREERKKRKTTDSETLKTTRQR